MFRQSVLRQSRHTKLALLMMWVGMAGVEIYFIASRSHSLKPIQWIIAAIWFLNAAIWIRLAVQSLKIVEAEDE